MRKLQQLGPIFHGHPFVIKFQPFKGINRQQGQQFSAMRGPAGVCGHKPAHQAGIFLHGFAGAFDHIIDNRKINALPRPQDGQCTAQRLFHVGGKKWFVLFVKIRGEHKGVFKITLPQLRKAVGHIPIRYPGISRKRRSRAK